MIVAAEEEEAWGFVDAGVLSGEEDFEPIRNGSRLPKSAMKQAELLLRGTELSKCELRARAAG